MAGATPGGSSGSAWLGRRVAVTGLGVLACCGTGIEDFWNGLLAAPPEGERRVKGYDPLDWFGPKEARRIDRFAGMAVAAAEGALADAGGRDAVVGDPTRAGVLIGSGVGGLATLEEQIVIHHEKGSRRVTPFLVPMMMSNAGAAAVSMRFGFQGPCETVVTACAAGTHSVGNAFQLVRSGRCDVVLAGSSEAAMTPVGIAGFSNMTALSGSGRSMPFDVDRDGFVISEGAGVLVLEEWDRAVARGARIYAEMLGSASTADAHHITAPAPGGSGAVTCMELAMSDARLCAADIRHINAHGTSTPLNDAAEAEAVAKVFGSPGPLITSTKGVTGHALGAAGSIEAVALALTLHHRLIPPTAGTTTVDPKFHLNLVLGNAREWEPGPSLSNSFGFGGHNGSLVMGPPTP